MAKKVSDFGPKHRQILSDIENRTFKSCYLTYGPESYLRDQQRDLLIKALVNGEGDMNFARYNAENADPGQMIDFAETMPFFADRRVLLVERSNLFRSGGCKMLADYLKSPSETCVFIFDEPDVDKRSDMYKAVSKYGLDIECEEQTPETLSKWVMQLFASEHKSISPRDAAYFIDHVGTDMSNIKTETEKLISYCLDRDTVTAQDISAVSANWLTGRIFEMTDSIAQKNQRRAIELYYDLLALKEEPVHILALITRQFNLMMQVKEMTDKRYGRDEIASSIGLNPYVVSKYQGWCNRYSFEDLRDKFVMCVEADEAIKTGRLNPLISVEMVIVRASAA